VVLQSEVARSTILAGDAMMDTKLGIPLAFLLALSAGGAGAGAAAVSGPADDLLRPGSLRELLPQDKTIPVVRADKARQEQLRAGCVYGYWRRC
jgi:hypothetical protein